MATSGKQVSPHTQACGSHLRQVVGDPIHAIVGDLKSVRRERFLKARASRRNVPAHHEQLTAKFARTSRCMSRIGDGS